MTAIGETERRPRPQVRASREDAEALGRRLADLVHDPDGFVRTASDGFDALADPAARAETARVAPGIGLVHGLTWPLLQGVERGFRRATRGVPPSASFDLVERLFRAPTLEERWFAFDLLDRALEDDPVLAWQDLRRGAREARDWITVDTLAHPVARGILLEPFRWSELEQLVFSPSSWERRLAGSTIATMPFVDRRAGRAPEIAERALPIVAMLMGDDAPEVQKALSWALRSLTLVDPTAVAEFCEREAERARREDDGYRAWVVRDTLPKLEPARADRIREVLVGIRRRAGAPATSEAAALVARFAGPDGLPDPTSHPAPRMPR